MGVGQLIGKLFGGEAGRNEAVLRAYGKLPIYAEYRRLELSPGTPIAFSQWLDAGRLAWVRSPSKSGASTTRPSRLMVGLPGAKEAIVASVWDSRDSLGRVFPFAFFVVCPAEALGGDLVERWVVATGIYRWFDRLYGQLHSLGSGGDFYRFYQKRSIALRPDDLAEQVEALRAAAAGIAAESWFKAVRFDGQITPATWLAGLLRRAERWKTQTAALAEAAVSCPLAQGFPYEAQAVLWLEWLGGLLKRVGKTPWLVVPMESAPSARGVHLVLRDLLPDDYQLLTTDDEAYGFVERLSSLPAMEAEALPAVDVPAESLLAWLRQHAP